MDISVNELTEGHSVTNADSYNTASISPASGALVLLAVGARSDDGGNPEIPTITGNGLTWTLVEEQICNNATNRRLFVFRGQGASPSSGAITIDFGTSNTMRSCVWGVHEFIPVKQGDDGGNAVIQSQTNQADTTALTVTLGAFSDADNATYGAFLGADGALSMSVEAGYTELTNRQDTENNTLLIEFLADNDTSVSESQSGSDVAGVAIEVGIAKVTEPLGQGIVPPAR